MSIHRHDGGRFYPASDYGAMDVTGSGPGIGKSVNIPWPRGGFGDAEYIYAFQKIVMPIAYEFAPELVISESPSPSISIFSLVQDTATLRR